jgi:hypothetical protein
MPDTVSTEVLLLANEAGVTVLDVPSLYVAVTVYVLETPSRIEDGPEIARLDKTVVSTTVTDRVPVTLVPFSL